MRESSVGFGLFIWVLLAGFYFLLTDAVSLAEGVAGGLTTAVVGGFVMVVRRVRRRRMALDAPWGRVIGRPLAAIGPDAFRVGRVLLGVLWGRPGGAVGVVSRQAFRHGGDDARSAGRRALVTLGISFAPNGYVLSCRGDDEVLVLHRLAPVADDPDREWPL